MRLDLLDAGAVRREAERVSIGVCSSTVLNEKTDITSSDPATRKNGVRYLTACVDATAAMGGNCFSGVIYSAIGKKSLSRPTEAEWDYSAAALRKVCAHARDQGVTVGLEPVNRYETYLVNTAAQALMLADRIGADNVAVHLDTYHMNIEEKDFYLATRSVGNRLCHYHLCENDRGIPGTGLVDWEGIFKALGEINYQGNAALESFVEVSDNMREATCVWRDLAPSGDTLVREGLAFIQKMKKKHFKH